MTPSRKEGLGMTDCEEIQEERIINRMGRIGKGGEIWATWMKKRYIGIRGLETIEEKRGDAPG